jgi:hypothetical protein
MDQSEYDRKFRKQGIIVGVDPDDGASTESIVVDGSSVAPLRLTVINSSPQDMHAREMGGLQEDVEVVGRIEGGVEIVRRRGGADYAGNDQWRQLMRRFGRLR